MWTAHVHRAFDQNITGPRARTEVFGAVSFRRIAAELGVSHMTLYSCFPSKDALLEALAARTIEVSADFDERQARDRLSMVFNYLLAAVLIDTRRRRGGAATSFARGLRYLVNGRKPDPP